MNYHESCHARHAILVSSMRMICAIACLLWPVAVYGQPSVTVSSASVPPGGALTVTVTGGPGSTIDWITMAPVGSIDTIYHGIWFLNGTPIPPTTGFTSAQFLITAPPVQGVYEV